MLALNEVLWASGNWEETKIMGKAKAFAYYFLIAVVNHWGF